MTRHYTNKILGLLKEGVLDEEEYDYDDSTDDGEALASAGFGTDEDYGYYGEE